MAIPVMGDVRAGPWLRVLSIPAAAPQDCAEQDFLAVLPAASAALASRRPFVAGWLCRGPGSPLELVTNAALRGRAGRSPGSGTVLFPAGARAVPASADWVDMLGRLVWAPCLGRQAPPAAPARRSAPEGGPPLPTRFELALTMLMGRPFGWLVVAEPTDDLDTELEELRTQVGVLRTREDERARFSAERAEQRLAELDTFREAGLWEVRVLVGAEGAGELAALAPVLVGSIDLSHHSYRLAAVAGAHPLAGALATRTADPRAQAQVPFRASAGLLSALAGLPRREVPGVRVIDSGYFDLTSETAPQIQNPPGTQRPQDGPAQISLGDILDGQDRPVGEFRVPLATLNRHALVTGATGSGKSQTVRHLLEQLTAAGLPWLVVEPVKSEYAGMAGRLAGRGTEPVTVVNPADPSAVPLSVNPLAPEPGYPVQAHIDMVRALFLAAFDADEPFPQIMAQALQRVYEANGWDVVTGGGMPGTHSAPEVPTLAQLQETATAVVTDVGYGRELQADVRGFVDVRLRSLRVGSAGRFFEGGHPADIAGLLQRNVVLAMEDIANDEDKAFLMGTLVIRVVEHLRLRARTEPAGGLRHVIVIEEAHRLLRARREATASAHAVELFASMLAEIRAYGEGLVVAEQIPAKLVPDVVKNTALKVVHRLPARDDRELVGAAMNLGDDQSKQVVALEPGVAAVFADGMDRPLRVRVPLGAARERTLPGPPPPLLGRRSAACGPRCAQECPCTQREMRQADLLATSPGHGEAWLRVWLETLVLAFLTNRGHPGVPGQLVRHWHGLGPRTRECLLATVAGQAVGERAAALRPSYPPALLTHSIAAAALALLGGDAGPGGQAGPDWVVPQLRWLHELDKVCPRDGSPPEVGRPAPPLDFDLPGLRDWPGMRVGDRLRVLHRHPYSTRIPHNQPPAWTALLGAGDQRGFGRDLAIVGVGLPPARQFALAAGLMGVRPWLEGILSWPRRFVAWDGGQAAATAGTEEGSGAK
ncbi:MAG TPA: ATP-binding protein [Streptosporangiaceae bacterium]|nr:ATP-binding protein [Streptosporangiaceae bacterium]